MQGLFVHGMGRTPHSARPLLRRLREQGISMSTFFYSVTFEDFVSIESRLRDRILQLARGGDYILIGHSLGGILIRGAIAGLPQEIPRPRRVFLLGSPVQPSRVAKYLSRNLLYRIATRDCGQLLASEERMQRVAACDVPTTSIVGTRGMHRWISPFGDEINDGVVTASEVAANWITEEVHLPVVHSFLPSSRLVTQVILERIQRQSESLSLAADNPEDPSLMQRVGR